MSPIAVRPRWANLQQQKLHSGISEFLAIQEGKSTIGGRRKKHNYEKNVNSSSEPWLWPKFGKKLNNIVILESHWVGKHKRHPKSFFTTLGMEPIRASWVLDGGADHRDVLHLLHLCLHRHTHSRHTPLLSGLLIKRAIKIWIWFKDFHPETVR